MEQSIPRGGVVEMSEKEQTFEEWSKLWDQIFEACTKRGMPYRELTKHTFRYKRRWNIGKL